jgi:hypothetical protein
MFSEFFKRNDFRGINENQWSEKKTWRWEKKFSFLFGDFFFELSILLTNFLHFNFYPLVD